MWISTAERSRTIDARATHEFGISAQVLMERAGLAVFDAVREMLGGGGRIAIFCGKGNNGGDGFAVARLAHKSGYQVDCLVAATESELGEDNRLQMNAARAQGVEPIFCDDARWARRLESLGRFDVIIDALLGTGARRQVEGPVRTCIQAINRSGVPAVAVDLPSGILCNTGEELGESIWALRTITFGTPKPFLFQGTGLEHSGYWSVADIGYPAELIQEPTEARIMDDQWVANLLPERLRASHKGENGSLLIVAGSERMRGAAVLCARAAMRSGIGLVTVASVGKVCDAIAAALPEATLLPLPEADGLIHPDAADVLLSQTRYHGAVFGPGLTHEPPVMEFLDRVFRAWRVPCVIDADALNAVSLGLALPEGECVLTPHPGEMSRLLKGSIAEIQADRFHTVDSAVRAFARTVLLKGPYSIVGDPTQPMMVNSSGNSGMASAGMGDVLAGVIGTLLAQELPPYYAASCGMYWHGASGDLCAQDIAPVGFTATDVADALPKARARMLASCEHC